MGIFGHFYALLLMLVFFGAIIVAAVWLVLWAIRVSPRRIRPDNALGILNERFARGEIDEREYEAKKAVLLQRQAPS